VYPPSLTSQTNDSTPCTAQFPFVAPLYFGPSPHPLGRHMNGILAHRSLVLSFIVVRSFACSPSVACGSGEVDVGEGANWHVGVRRWPSSVHVS
jgi:hypothetical protein